MKSVVSSLILLCIVLSGEVSGRRLQEIRCLPKSSCAVEQPLCKNCLPDDTKCQETPLLTEGFCAPFKDYTVNEPISRQTRYAACKESAVARALPWQRSRLEDLKNRYFYKNCIYGEYMCGDGSCQHVVDNCERRGGIQFYPANHTGCTSEADFDDVNQPNNEVEEDEEDGGRLGTGEPEMGVNSSRMVDGIPVTLNIKELMRFCTYFYEVVMLGGQKESEASAFYVDFLYKCFQDYHEFGSVVQAQTMNEFHELSGQRAIKNLGTFDARNYPGTPAYNPQ